MAAVDVLLPTCNRHASLVMTLSGLAVQSLCDLRVIVADQSEKPGHDDAVVQSLLRVIEARGGEVEWHDRRAVDKGIAEQRDFLLRQATSEAVLYLDDDVLMEAWVVERLLYTLREQGCGFVGAFPAGLSYLGDVRPQQQIVDYFEGPVRAEAVEPGTPEWARWNLHRAANLYHVSRRLRVGEFRLYKVAWIASCVMYDRAKLLEVGGFSFWSRLPRYHSGEEALAQNLLMRRWGGCGLMPSGAYYSEMPSTVLNGEGRVDGHALDLLPEMVARYAPSASGSATPRAVNCQPQT